MMQRGDKVIVTGTVIGAAKRMVRMQLANGAYLVVDEANVVAASLPKPLSPLLDDEIVPPPPKHLAGPPEDKVIRGPQQTKTAQAKTKE